MRNTQARRHRRIVGPNGGDRARAVSDGPARLPLDPDQADVSEWENEGGARYPAPGRGADRPRPDDSERADRSMASVANKVTSRS